MRPALLLVVIVAACSFDPPPPPPTDDGGAPITVAFDLDGQGADESSGVVTVDVVLSAAAPAAVSVRCIIDGGTAIENTDFTFASTMLRFEPGETRKSFEVVILVDSDENEDIESIPLELTDPSGVLLGVEARHTINISDVILPRVTVAQTTTSTTEGTQTTLAVMLDKPAVGNAQVTVAISGGTATPADDFGLVAGAVIMIPAGTTTGSVAIAEVEDSLDEDDPETLIVELENPSANILLGASTTTTHSIQDNDNPPTIGFQLADQQVTEPGGGTLQLVVALGAPSGRTITVDFARDDGGDSAVDNDVTFTAGSLTFAPGVTTQTITLGIVNDNRQEQSETVRITLANAVNASLATAAHVVTITDDDPTPTVAFQVATSNASESSQQKNLVVQLSNPTALATITVEFMRTGGSASEAAVVTPSPLAFPPDTTQQNIRVTWNDDFQLEGTETVIVRIMNPSGAALGAVTQHTLSINDF